MSDENICTPKEIEVLLLIYSGKTNEQIAKELFISISTVKTHIRNLFQKSQTQRRMQLVAWALKNKIITEP